MDAGVSYFIDIVLKKNAFSKQVSDQLDSCITLLMKERNHNIFIKRQYISLFQSVTSNSIESSSFRYESDRPSGLSMRHSLKVTYEKEPTDNQFLPSESTISRILSVISSNSNRNITSNNIREDKFSRLITAFLTAYPKKISMTMNGNEMKGDMTNPSTLMIIPTKFSRKIFESHNSDTIVCSICRTKFRGTINHNNHSESYHGKIDSDDSCSSIFIHLITDSNDLLVSNSDHNARKHFDNWIDNENFRVQSCNLDKQAHHSANATSSRNLTSSPKIIEIRFDEPSASMKAM